jgi:hypothetical protein
MGRIEEIKEISQFLHQDNMSGRSSDDEDNDDDGSLF